MKFTIVFTIVILSSFATAKANTMTHNEKYLLEAHLHADEYGSEKEPERLREAAMALQNVLIADEPDPTSRSRTRSECLSLWIRLVELLDVTRDRNFNPAQVPDRLVQPPVTKTGVMYPPGADPALIDDPHARAEYTKEIRDNQKRLENYRRQVSLLPLKDELPERAKDFIRKNYSVAERDREEIERAIERTITDPDRKAEFVRVLRPLEVKPQQ